MLKDYQDLNYRIKQLERRIAILYIIMIIMSIVMIVMRLNIL